MKKGFLFSTAKAMGLAVTLVAIGGLHIAASAQSVNARENRIVGVWEVQVNNLNCSTGAQVSSFRGMHKYELGRYGTNRTCNKPGCVIRAHGRLAPCPVE